MGSTIILILYPERWLSAGNIYLLHTRGGTIGPSPRIEISLRPDWFYFGQDGVLQEFVGKQVLEAKTATNTNKHHGEEYDSPAEK